MITKKINLSVGSTFIFGNTVVYVDSMPMVRLTAEEWCRNEY